jgi:YHS domain-containing protein
LTESKLEFHGGQYAFCATHWAKKVADNVKNSAKNNGSDAHLASLRKHFANKKDKVDVEIPIVEAIHENIDHFLPQHSQLRT